MSRLLVIRLVVLSMVLLAFSSMVFADKAPVSVQLSLEKPSITLGEPFVVKYCITDEADEQVSVNFGKDRVGWYNIIITGPSGQPLAKRHFFELPEQGGLKMSPIQKLQPGESYRGALVLSQDYILPRPGIYAITIDYKLPVKIGKMSDAELRDQINQESYIPTATGENNSEQVVSTQYVLLLEVIKADPERLNTVISELTAIIRSKGDGNRKPTAIQSLFAMPQSQAINAWRELVLDPERGLDALYMQEMLFRFATPDTADILASMGSSSELNSVTAEHAETKFMDISVNAGHAQTTLMNIYWAGDESLKKYVELLFKKHGWDTSHLGNPVLALD